MSDIFKDVVPAMRFIENKIVEAEKTLQTREGMRDEWLVGNDSDWRAGPRVAPGSKFIPRAERIKLSERDGRIAEKNRQELQMFKSVLKHLTVLITAGKSED